MLARSLVIAAGLAVASCAAGPAPLPSTSPSQLQFIVTSDAHYGITRQEFRGAHDVDAQIVNQALVAAMNQVPGSPFPRDGGIGAGRTAGPIDFVVEAGDVTNRAEDSDGETIQPAALSWRQFVRDYLNGVRLTDRSGRTTPVLIVPGNHEASNAVGYYQHMTPATDPTPLVEIYNRMVIPLTPLRAATFDYQRDRVFFTRDFGGIHFIFIHVWPDSAMRARMDEDLRDVTPTTPVMVVAHDQPDVQSKHLGNPNGAHDINPTDQFENLLADTFADGRSIDVPSLKEQAEFEAFLGRHPNITAYFHGNSNWHQVYDWNGPNKTARLHTVRIDSPMKGAVSALDEKKLSFAVVTIDLAQRVMSVRECLWNANPAHSGAEVHWGETVTTTLDPRPGS
jgi:hypothetical protein